MKLLWRSICGYHPDNNFKPATDSNTLLSHDKNRNNTHDSLIDFSFSPLRLTGTSIVPSFTVTSLSPPQPPLGKRCGATDEADQLANDQAALNSFKPPTPRSSSFSLTRRGGKQLSMLSLAPGAGPNAPGMLKKLNNARAKFLRRGSASSIRSTEELRAAVPGFNPDEQPAGGQKGPESGEGDVADDGTTVMADEAQRGGSSVDLSHQPQLSPTPTTSSSQKFPLFGSLADSTSSHQLEPVAESSSSTFDSAAIRSDTRPLQGQQAASDKNYQPRIAESPTAKTDSTHHDTLQELSSARRERISNIKSQGSGSAPPFRYARSLHETGGSHSRTSSRDISVDEAVIAHRYKMIKRIWVRRPGASPTMVKIQEDYLVDDVRDLILRKYQNSLGRSFDAPDITIRILPRDKSQRTSSEIDRVLLPDEQIAKTIDLYYPSGQSSDEALLIDIPHKRTPKASPGLPVLLQTAGDDYFSVQPTPNSGHAHGGHYFTSPGGNQPHSISILTTGQLPSIPLSPGVNRVLPKRPKTRTVQTSSPILLSAQAAAAHAAAAGTDHHSQSSRSLGNSVNSDLRSPPVPAAPPTPPVTETARAIAPATTPPARVASPRPKAVKKPKKPEPSSLLPHVPPISVLIVEDNMINLRLLEAMVKRLKIRWESAVNGKQAVDKWRNGGFHLVLMDIQLPIMSGLDATKEIRRLERVNNIGVFNSMAASGPPTPIDEKPSDADRLDNIMTFKSPVIIVALTASSLQSDRHEALAAGCNDFLTKPVRFDWLERKVLEWGCMQAMIDFSGWRKWRELANGKDAGVHPRTLAGQSALNASIAA